MKKRIGLLLCVILFFGCAKADRTVQLPQSRYVIDVPDWMRYSAEDSEHSMEAYTSEMLEIDYTCYPKSSVLRDGETDSLRVLAEKSVAKGMEAELRQINGIEMVCYRLTDASDDAPCIGYLFEDGDMLVEIDFWYATQEAADLTGKIISTIREGE